MRKSRNDYVLGDLCRIFLGLYELMKVGAVSIFT